MPIVVGSAGTAGGDPHVDWMMDIVREVIATAGLERKVAAIKSEQDPDYLKDDDAEGPHPAAGQRADFRRGGHRPQRPASSA